MDLDEKPVGPGCDRRQRDRGDEVPLAGAVRGIGDDRKVREPLQHRDRVHVEGVAGVSLERADPALAEDHVPVPAREDVLG